MRVYADSSFILRLVTSEADSPATIAEYRRLGSPKLFFVPLQALEVRNAILQKGFHQRRSVSSDERREIRRERDAALGKLARLIDRRALIEVSINADAAVANAIRMSSAHTERIGARAIDLLHVATALTLQTELFLTTDARQAQLAKAEGLKVA